MKEFIWKLCKVLQWMAVIMSLAACVLPFVFWSKIPDTVPTHFGMSGAADNWGGKEIILMLMILNMVLVGMMSIAAYCVKKEKWYPMIVWMNFMLELFMVFAIFACATAMENLGKFTLPVYLILLFGPIVFFVFKQYRRNKHLAKERFSDESMLEGVIWKSRVDIWLAALLVGSVIIVPIMFVVETVKEQKVNVGMLITCIVLCVIILPLFQIKYVLYPKFLKVDCGLYGKERIPYESITEMKKTMNPLSSAALSLRRIEIHYVIDGCHKMTLISPKNRDLFMEEIEKRRVDRCQ